MPSADQFTQLIRPCWFQSYRRVHNVYTLNVHSVVTVFHYFAYRVYVCRLYLYYLYSSVARQMSQ